MKIIDQGKDKVWEGIDAMTAQAQAKYVSDVMEWEECDYETALAICTGRTVPREPEYTLGFKMSNPVLLMAMFYQLSKKKRDQAIANFKLTLDPDELQIFVAQVENDATRKQLKKEYKEEKKKAKS